MSYSKRILFGDDPADAAVRAQLEDKTRAHLAAFTFKIPVRRKNPLPGPYWDPRWRVALDRAVRELAVRVVNINDQVCASSQADANAIKAKAEVLYQVDLSEARSIISGSARSV
jgi:hypothetical protein